MQRGALALIGPKEKALAHAILQQLAAENLTIGQAKTILELA